MAHLRTVPTILLLFTSMPLMADTQNLRGDAFSSPSARLSMPAGWEKEPVKYGNKVEKADLVISFGQQTHPAFHKLVSQYAKDNDLNIVIQSGTCGVSAGKLLRKSIDSGTFCCPPSKKDRLPGLEYHTLAISALSIFVNEKNPVDGVSTNEARQIFQGKVRKWDEFKSASSFNETIRPHIRLHCKKRPGHWRLILKDQEKFSPILKEVGVIPDLVAKVGQLENSVSVETPFMIKTYQKGPVKMLKIDGHSPEDIKHVASGKYPFYRTYSVTTWSHGGKKKETALKLISFLRDYIDKNQQSLSMVSTARLKKAGWKFKGDELIAEPGGKDLAYYPPKH